MPMRKQATQKLTDQLRRITASSGKTLGELSRETGIDTSALSRFVNGERGLSMEALDALGQHLRLVLVARRPAKRAKKGR